jgi:hypothetical protein
VRDPRVDTNDNGQFMDMMERYFERGADEKLVDTRPELSYQVRSTYLGVSLLSVLHCGPIQVWA